MVTLGRQGRQALARKKNSLSSWGRINTYWSWSWGNTSTVRLMKKHEGMKKVIYNSLEVSPANAFLVSNLWYRHGTIYCIFATLCLHQHFGLMVGGFSGVSPVLSVLSGLFLSSRIVTNPNVQSWVWELREFYPHWTMHQAPGSSTWTPHFSHFFLRNLFKRPEIVRSWHSQWTTVKVVQWRTVIQTGNQ